LNDIGNMPIVIVQVPNKHSEPDAFDLCDLNSNTQATNNSDKQSTDMELFIEDEETQEFPDN
jgi:hypothetical protein